MNNLARQGLKRLLASENGWERAESSLALSAASPSA